MYCVALYHYCMHRHVTLLQVSYGIRFDDQPSANAFLDKLANEVSARLKDQGCKGKTLQLGLKRQKPVSPAKFEIIHATG
jgi:impB/mucB/samB family C-terminal domain